MTAESIAIVGPGRMGVGIATAVLMADRGHRVTLIDSKRREPGKETETLDAAREEVKANLELLNGLGLLHTDTESLIGGLEVATGLNEAIAGHSFVFEALPENVAIKQDSTITKMSTPVRCSTKNTWDSLNCCTCTNNPKI